MFDISWGKLIIIGVVALIVIGPKELPTVLRTVGQWMAKIRRMAGEFQGQFQDAMREAEMADLKKEFDETNSAVASAFDTSAISANLEKMIEEPTGSTPPAPAVETSDPGAITPSDPVGLGTAPVAPQAEISVPMPELPPPPESKDFAAAPSAPEPAVSAPASPEPEAGGGKAA